MNNFTILSSQKLLSGKIFNIIDHEVEISKGKIKHYTVIKHPGAVVLIPKLDDDKFILIKQYRHSIEKHILEFPAGTIEKDESDLICAQREIREEVGYAAKKWTQLGYTYPSPGFCSEKITIFLAEDLYESSLPLDEDELIETVIMNKDEIIAAIKDGSIQDAKTIAAFYKYLI